jgi:hypothetical protein
MARRKEPSLWRHLDMTSHNNVVKEKIRSGAIDVLCAMAKEAVARSSGQLRCSRETSLLMMTFSNT